MRSRAARLVWMATALVALGAAAFLLVRIDQPLTDARTRLRTFDLRARDAVTLLADLRVAQQAYVAAGQSTAFWMPKVSGLLHDSAEAVDTLRPLAASVTSRQILIEVSSSITGLATLDKRAREYIASNEPLMASDLVFTEGGEVAAEAARRIEAARIAEHQAFDALNAGTRRTMIAVLGSAAGVLALAVVLLGMAPAPRRVTASATADAPAEDLPLQDVDAPAEPSATPAATSGDAAALLTSTAGVCTGFGTIRDLSDLKSMLEQAASVMDSSGMVVWLGDAAGNDLQAVVAYGYADHVLARMKRVPRGADNAAAAAYRSATLQVVPAQGKTLGAVVAPIVSVDGCIGALTAETRAGRETLPAVHAVATIFAAQLAGVLAGASAESPAAEPTVRAASA